MGGIEFTTDINLEFKGIPCFTVVPVCLTCLVYLLAYIVHNDLSYKFHAKIIVALGVMLLSYVLTFLWVLDQKFFFFLNLHKFWELYFDQFAYTAWFLRGIPTLLYTW